MSKQTKITGSKRATVGKRQSVLTKRAAAKLGEPGAFALHLAALLQERGWTHQDLAQKCQAAGLPIEEHAVRAWLRGENMPKSHHLRPLAEVLGLNDRRQILPG